MIWVIGGKHMRLYLKAKSDTHKEVAIGGNNELEVTLFYGSRKDSRRAVTVKLFQHPETGKPWFEIEGPRHGIFTEGRNHFDMTRGALPE